MSTLRWTYNEVMYESRFVVSLGQLVGRRALQRLQQAVLYQSHPLCNSVDNAQRRCGAMKNKPHIKWNKRFKCWFCVMNYAGYGYGATVQLAYNSYVDKQNESPDA